MAIEGIIGSLGGYTTIGAAQRATQRDVRAGNAANGDPSGRQGGVPFLSLRAPTIRVSSPAPPVAGDTAELSSRARAANLLKNDSEGPQALVESFVRQRATYAYRSPQVQGKSSFDFTFDVEVAYRVIQLVPAGSVVDIEG